jgi:hypothetical protein
VRKDRSMKREFDIGDIAHLSNGKRIKLENGGALTLKADTAVTVVEYCKMDRSVGGWGYLVEYEGKRVAFELPQNDFYDKAMWNRCAEIEERIEMLQ